MARGDNRNDNRDDDRDNEFIDKLVHINRVAKGSKVVAGLVSRHSL